MNEETKSVPGLPGKVSSFFLQTSPFQPCFPIPSPR
jgi:hypothetical protein